MKTKNQNLTKFPERYVVVDIETAGLFSEDEITTQLKAQNTATITSSFLLSFMLPFFHTQSIPYKNNSLQKQAAAPIATEYSASTYTFACNRLPHQFVL